MQLKEFRCSDCNKLLGKYYGAIQHMEIKCPRCDKINTVEALEAPVP